jgi:hypothetical protein
VVVPEGGFSVSYTLNKYQPVTVPVQVSGSAGNLLTSSTIKVDPNPVVAELQLIVPPKPARKPMRPKRAKPADTTAAPTAADPAFPAPASSTR